MAAAGPAAALGLIRDRNFGRREHFEQTALAIAALCIGGMVIARASEDLAIADEVREAAQVTALALGGWVHAT